MSISNKRLTNQRQFGNTTIRVCSLLWLICAVSSGCSPLLCIGLISNRPTSRAWLLGLCRVSESNPMAAGGLYTCRRAPSLRTLAQNAFSPLRTCLKQTDLKNCYAFCAQLIRRPSSIFISVVDNFERVILSCFLDRLSSHLNPPVPGIGHLNLRLSSQQHCQQPKRRKDC